MWVMKVMQQKVFFVTERYLNILKRKKIVLSKFVSKKMVRNVVSKKKYYYSIKLFSTEKNQKYRFESIFNRRE